ncbi:hypothetical protein IFM89_032897 [Coptis chinensis]|uniref:Uncharacterized protein n=1 Tax=Coptis chinensis TaxID=261450 RepID=A0A835MAR1_9MAGN|nr:hypothetical protein IFM89_032897 [Coptis chinensis]
MEGVYTNIYKGIKRYWNRKNYQRLNGSGSRRQNRVELAGLGTNRRRRRFWRIKITPKLRILSFSSAKKVLIRLRDSYVNMMIGVANSTSLSAAAGFGGAVGSGQVGYGIRRDPLKEYDEKVIVEIYKSLMKQGQLVPHGVGISAPGLVCR